MPEGNPISSVQENSNTSRKAQSTVVDSTLIASVSETSQRRNESGLPRRQPDPPPVGASAKRHPLSMLFCCLSSGVDNTDGHELSVSRQKSGASSNPTAVSSTGRKLVNPSANLLKPIAPEEVGKKCLVLDLDETLVHSSFKPVAQADFVIPVEIDNQVHNVYVLKRPGVDVFLQRLGPQFEIVVFTASLAKYADPVLDMLDKHRVVKHRLFREACIHHKGNYVKDLGTMGRPLKDTIIIDNSPASYVFHPTNAIPITSWFNDPNDTELYDLIPFLEDLKMVDDVTVVLDNTTE